MSGAPYRTIAVTALCVAVASLAAALRMSVVAADMRRECALCAAAASDLAPYVEEARSYAKAKTVFERDVSDPPRPRLGLPPAKVSTERAGTAFDGLIPWHITYSWDKLEAGQAFAALDAFTSQGGAVRIHELRLEASADGVSLKVMLRGASRAAGGE
jgi:hypothetical protein